MYKYCCSSSASKRHEYYKCFLHEYTQMKKLQNLMNGISPSYDELFPTYHEYGTDNNFEPYIIMDFIPGVTLESWLRRAVPSTHYRNPHRILSDHDILYLFSQINDAQYWLNKVNMLQLDLNPGNIILSEPLNNNFKIKLIDFTDAYYNDTVIQADRLNRSYKLIDDARPDRRLKGHPELQLREAGILLFTRLFYSGDVLYKTNHQDSLRFFKPYASLLNSRLSPETIVLNSSSEDNLLFYWNQWFEELKRLCS